MHIKKIIACSAALLLGAGVLLAQDTGETSPEVLDSVNGGAADGRVNIAFRKVRPESKPGGVTVFNPAQALAYDNINETTEYLQGRIPGLVSGINLRGLGDALVVVDGLPRPMSTVNVQEIDHVTFLRGANAAMLYGVQGKNGVIMVTTKRGIPGEKKISVWADYGMSSPLSLPKYVDAANYMVLFNEARANDGLAPLYDDQTIQATQSGSDPLRYPDTEYFSSEFLRSTKPSARGVAEFSGGDEKAQYYVNAGWISSGSLLKLGEESRDRLNLRSNINFRINSFITSHVDVIAVFENDKGPVRNFWEDAANLRPDLYAPRIDVSRLSSTEILQSATLVGGRYLLGGTSQFQNNIYGNMELGGYSNRQNALAQFNTGVDIDLGALTPGLSIKTLVGLDYNKIFTESQVNQYAVYSPEWITGEDGQEILELTKIGTDRFTGTQELSNSNILRRIGLYGALNYQRQFNNRHDIAATVVAYGDKLQQTGILQDDNHTHIGMNLNYLYNGRYAFDFSSAIVSSAKLPEGNRTGFSPSVGLGWIVSNEDFLADNATIDFLKFNVSASRLNTDLGISEYYLYQNAYIAGNPFTWNDNNRTNRSTVFSNVGNGDLFFERREELNVGAEMLAFNESVSLDVNVFWDRITNQITRLSNQYPSYLGGNVPYTNYNEDRYRGFELGATWSRSSGNFGIDVGLNVTYVATEVSRRDENWEFDYQYRRGNPVNAIYGYEADGFFRDDAEIAAHASQTFGQVRPGDIKYVDQNSDGIIDQNDQIMIGRNLPDLAGGLSLTLKYKNLSLFTLATALNGSDRFYNDSYYWVYGDRKYSDVVRNRWTPETAETATYPRLSSQASSNNFRNSTFWLYNDSRITLNRVQLTYSFPDGFGSRIGLANFSVYGRAGNLYTFSKNRERMMLNVGMEPQYRIFALGLKANFK